MISFLDFKKKFLLKKNTCFIFLNFKNLRKYDLTTKFPFFKKIESFEPKLILYTSICNYTNSYEDNLIIFNSFKIMFFYSQQTSLFKKKIITRKSRKKESVLIYSYPTGFNKFRLLIYLNVILKKFFKIKVLSDYKASFSCKISNLTFFSNYLDESFTNWNKSIFFRIYFNTRINFLFLKDSFYYKVLLSLLNFKCERNISGFNYNYFFNFKKYLFFTNENY